MCVRARRNKERGRERQRQTELAGQNTTMPHTCDNTPHCANRAGMPKWFRAAGAAKTATLELCSPNPQESFSPYLALASSEHFVCGMRLVSYTRHSRRTRHRAGNVQSCNALCFLVMEARQFELNSQLYTCWHCRNKVHQEKNPECQDCWDKVP